MKAAMIQKYGASDVFAVQEAEKPKPGPKDVLIKIHASSVNPIDWKIRQGTQRGVIHPSFPAILGMDLSGVVEAVGEQVTRFQPGDEVYSSPTHRRQGTYAEYTLVEESACARKPKNLTHQEAASIPLVGLTAWEALVVKGKLQKGQKVLIQAGAGGVGSIAIQMAKHMGAFVIATCSTRNVELLKELGADQVVDYTKERFDEVLKDVDLVVDCLAGDYPKRSLKIIKRGGHLTMLSSDMPKYSKTFGPYLGVLATGMYILACTIRGKLRGVSTSMVVRQTSGALLDKITELIEKEAVRPLIDKVYSLDEIHQAHAYSETGRARGKIVIEVAT